MRLRIKTTFTFQLKYIQYQCVNILKSSFYSKDSQVQHLFSMMSTVKIRFLFNYHYVYLTVSHGASTEFAGTQTHLFTAGGLRNRILSHVFSPAMAGQLGKDAGRRRLDELDSGVNLLCVKRRLRTNFHLLSACHTLVCFGKPSVVWSVSVPSSIVQVQRQMSGFGHIFLFSTVKDKQRTI